MSPAILAQSSCRLEEGSLILLDLRTEFLFPTSKFSKCHINGFCNKEGRREKLLPYYLERSPILSVNIKDLLRMARREICRSWKPHCPLKTLQKSSKNVNDFKAISFGKGTEGELDETWLELSLMNQNTKLEKFHLRRSSEALNWHSEAPTDISRSAFHEMQCPLQYTKLSK